MSKSNYWMFIIQTNLYTNEMYSLEYFEKNRSGYVQYEGFGL